MRVEAKKNGITVAVFDDGRDKTDYNIQAELDFIANMIQDKVYDDYCIFEDEVADLIKLHCPICQSEIDKVTIGIFMVMGNIRNYVREKANIQFVL